MFIWWKFSSLMLSPNAPQKAHSFASWDQHSLSAMSLQPFTILNPYVEPVSMQ